MEDTMQKLIKVIAQQLLTMPIQIKEINSTLEQALQKFPEHIQTIQTLQSLATNMQNQPITFKENTKLYAVPPIPNKTTLPK